MARIAHCPRCNQLAFECLTDTYGTYHECWGCGYCEELTPPPEWTPWTERHHRKEPYAAVLQLVNQWRDPDRLREIDRAYKQRQREKA